MEFNNREASMSGIHQKISYEGHTLFLSDHFYISSHDVFDTEQLEIHSETESFSLMTCIAPNLTVFMVMAWI